MRGGVARRRSGGVDAATALLLDDDSQLRNVSGNFALHVLVASVSDGACGQEPSDTVGENVVVTETRVQASVVALLNATFRLAGLLGGCQRISPYDVGSKNVTDEARGKLRISRGSERQRMPTQKEIVVESV